MFEKERAKVDKRNSAKRDEGFQNQPGPGTIRKGTQYSEIGATEMWEIRQVP